MSKISGKETKPEIIVRSYLFAEGFRYRKNDKRYPGKPDILLPKYKTAIFIHGCFWHGHNCKYGRLPKSNKLFWTKKISTNINKDRVNKTELLKLGWKVVIVWQCQIDTQEKRKSELLKIKNSLITV